MKNIFLVMHKKIKLYFFAQNKQLKNNAIYLTLHKTYKSIDTNKCNINENYKEEEGRRYIMNIF